MISDRESFEIVSKRGREEREKKQDEPFQFIDSYLSLARDSE
jgi:hypothetical protein